eukprot:6194357-Pleurochrysis_carterae.AAC.2
MHAAYRCSAASNAALVLKMWTAGLIADPRIRTVLERQDRGNYCKDLSTCYNDSPQQESATRSLRSRQPKAHRLRLHPD